MVEDDDAGGGSCGAAAAAGAVRVCFSNRWKRTDAAKAGIERSCERDSVTCAGSERTKSVSKT